MVFCCQTVLLFVGCKWLVLYRQSRRVGVTEQDAMDEQKSGLTDIKHGVVLFLLLCAL